MKKSKVISIGAIALLIIIGGIIFIPKRIKARAYDNLVDIYHNYQELAVEASDYHNIADSFKTFGDYKEAKTYYKLSIEAEANLYWNAGNDLEAYKLLKQLGYKKDNNDIMSSLIEANQRLELMVSEPGDVITFGRYEQDGNFENGYEELKWIVLEVDGNKRLLLTEDCIECMPYNFEAGKTNWNEATVNDWLNASVVLEMFDSSERDILIASSLASSTNPDYGTKYDKSESVMFLLSLQDARKYFGNKSYEQDGENGGTYIGGPELEANLSTYMINRGASSQCTGYWLRTPGIDYDGAVYVSHGGYVHTEGDGCIKYNLIRPAVWIDVGE